MSKYTFIDKDNLPKPGDIIATDKNLGHPDDEDFEKEFICSSMFEIIKESGTDDKTGAPVYKTKDLSKTCPKELIYIERHKLVESTVNDWFIINDVSKRNHKIDSLLND